MAHAGRHRVDQAPGEVRHGGGDDIVVGVALDRGPALGDEMAVDVDQGA